MPDNSSKKNEEEKEEIREKRGKWGKWLIGGAITLLVFFLIGSYLAGLPKVNQDSGRINFVLLGISGNDQKPPDLTDTIVFASFNKFSGKTFVLSLPRDIWLDSLKAKINTAYHYGGFSLVKSSIQEILGQPVHYIFVLDFEGFKKIVDFLGGIDIYIERTFDDYRYPIPGKEDDECGGDKEFKCRYEHLHFDAGWEKMNGERALKFVRSRNAEGDEGTDFARNQRQQKFLLALKNKISSSQVLLNPQKVFGLVKILPSLLKTDLKKEEYFSFGLSFLRFDSQKIEMQLLNGSGPVGFLYHPLKHSSGQWVLIPKSGDWEKIKEFVVQRIW